MDFFFSLAALSCPYGQKLKIHDGNWAVAGSTLCYIYFVLYNYLKDGHKTLFEKH